MLNAMPTADLLVRDSRESNKGKDFGSHYLQLVCRHTLPLCSTGEYVLPVNNRAKSLFDRRWGAHRSVWKPKLSSAWMPTVEPGGVVASA